MTVSLSMATPGEQTVLKQSDSNQDLSRYIIIFKPPQDTDSWNSLSDEEAENQLNTYINSLKDEADVEVGDTLSIINGVVVRMSEETRKRIEAERKDIDTIEKDQVVHAYPAQV
jgi:hypothetical protein